MKFCEYINNFNSLFMLVYPKNKVQIKYNFDLNDIYSPSFITNPIDFISLKVEKPAKADEINQITKLYQNMSDNRFYKIVNKRQVKFINEHIKTYRMIPMYLEIDYTYNYTKRDDQYIIESGLGIILKEGIRGNNPNVVSLIFGGNIK